MAFAVLRLVVNKGVGKIVKDKKTTSVCEYVPRVSKFL